LLDSSLAIPTQQTCKENHMRRTNTLALALLGTLLISGYTFAAGGGGVLVDPGAMEGKHFDPKGKMPSKFTVELQNGLRKTLPFEDKRDFDEAKRGFIAAPPYKQIMAEAGNVAWDMGSYEYLLQGKDFDSIHPSLQRQAILNMLMAFMRLCRAKFIKSVVSTSPTSASSRATLAGSCSTR
jgi:hypothetical protein